MCGCWKHEVGIREDGESFKKNAMNLFETKVKIFFIYQMTDFKGEDFSTAILSFVESLCRRFVNEIEKKQFDLFGNPKLTHTP